MLSYPLPYLTIHYLSIRQLFTIFYETLTGQFYFFPDKRMTFYTPGVLSHKLVCRPKRFRGDCLL